VVEAPAHTQIVIANTPLFLGGIFCQYFATINLYQKQQFLEMELKIDIESKDP
jgi:hypothetical protein